MLRVHPDLFSSNPIVQTQNQESLQKLNAFMTSMKHTSNEQPYPPAQQTKLLFYIPNRLIKTPSPSNTSNSSPSQTKSRQNNGFSPTSSPPSPSSHHRFPHANRLTNDGEYTIIDIIMTTNGGVCKNMVEKSLSSLFGQAGLPHIFRWDKQYWPNKPARLVETEPTDQEETGEDQYM